MARTSAPPSRTSARLAGKPAPVSSAGPKKAAVASSAKAAASKTSKAAKAEAAAEAPASAKPSTAGAGAKVKLGDALPALTLENEQGEPVDVGALAAGGRGVVVFTYPRANTPGCTSQACGFRDALDDIKAEGYDVYGLSLDKPTSQMNWSKKNKLTFNLLCDPDQLLIKKLGAFVPPKNTKRSHFIFEKGTGKLVDAQYGVKPADDPKKCLAFIREHHA